MPFPSVGTPPVADLSGVERRLVAAGGFLPASVFADTAAKILGGNGAFGTLATASPASLFVSLDPADFAVTGKTTKLRFSTEIETADTAIGTTITFALQALTGITGTSTITRTLAAAAASVLFTTPAANSHPARQTQEIDFPTAGLYVITATAGAAFASGAVVYGGVNVNVRNV